MRASLAAGLFVLLAAVAAVRAQNGRSYATDHVWWNAGDRSLLPLEEVYENPDGQTAVLNKRGLVRSEGHPFFERLGTNGRACITCHQPSNAMGVSAAAVRQRWTETKGEDPVFAAIDGSNCPDLPQDAAASHSLLLTRGLFRIFLPWPPKDVDPEFRIEILRDPTGCNTDGRTISVYRRPRIAANLGTLVAGPSGVSFMADGREPSLEAQATTAALVHEQASRRPTPEQLARIVEFEMQIFAAQQSDIRGGLLNEKDGPALLGPANLASGRAGTMGADGAFASFAIWAKPAGAGDLGLQREFRASVARGSLLFSTKKFQAGTCATCHSPGTTRWMDIGTANVDEPAKASPDLPLFRVTCDSGRVVYTQDPGRALISGKCADVGAIVLQQLRGLAARAPYFSNGRAGTLEEVVEFYDRRFGIGYTEQEKRDLANFLRVL